MAQFFFCFLLIADEISHREKRKKWLFAMGIGLYYLNQSGRVSIGITGNKMTLKGLSS